MTFRIAVLIAMFQLSATVHATAVRGRVSDEVIGPVNVARTTLQYDRAEIDACLSHLEVERNLPVIMERSPAQPELQGWDIFSCRRAHGTESRDLKGAWLRRDLSNLDSIQRSSFVDLQSGCRFMEETEFVSDSQEGEVQFTVRLYCRTSTRATSTAAREQIRAALEAIPPRELRALTESATDSSGAPLAQALHRLFEVRVDQSDVSRSCSTAAQVSIVDEERTISDPSYVDGRLARVGVGQCTIDAQDARAAAPRPGTLPSERSIVFDRTGNRVQIFRGGPLRGPLGNGILSLAVRPLIHAARGIQIALSREVPFEAESSQLSARVLASMTSALSEPVTIWWNRIDASGDPARPGDSRAAPVWLVERTVRLSAEACHAVLGYGHGQFHCDVYRPAAFPSLSRENGPLNRSQTGPLGEWTEVVVAGGRVASVHLEADVDGFTVSLETSLRDFDGGPLSQTEAELVVTKFIESFGSDPTVRFRYMTSDAAPSDDR